MPLRARFSPGEAHSELDAAAVRRIDAAEGHHMLGMYQAAVDEIAELLGDERHHPAVLHIACRAYWGGRKIPEARACAQRFIQAAPDHPFGYGFLAMLLSYVDEHNASYTLLKSAVARFPNHATMHYDLARVAAKCELWSEAKHWIYASIAIDQSMKELALHCPDLAPIRTEIVGMGPRS